MSLYPFAYAKVRTGNIDRDTNNTVITAVFTESLARKEKETVVIPGTLSDLLPNDSAHNG